jgi:hypothetical protein
MAKREASSNAETPRIADKVLFWEEQDRINKELIPRVIKLHALFPQHVERHGDASALIAALQARSHRLEKRAYLATAAAATIAVASIATSVALQRGS